MGDIASNEMTVSVPDEIIALTEQYKTTQTKIDDNYKIINKNTDFTLCPICQKGYLYPHKKGKILGIINDMWLTCNTCTAEFDQKRDKALLVKATEDPYGTFKRYADQTLPLDEWKGISLARIRLENNKHEEELSLIKSKLRTFLIKQFLDGQIKLIAVDTNCFLLKKGEVALFGTQAEIIEERKRRVTQRTSTGGGGRSYNGFSFRVAKGIYYHTGASRPTSQRQTTVHSSEYTELVSADNGDFLITNQRLLFKGNRSRGVAMPISKVAALDIDPEQNALMIIAENKKPVILKLTTNLKANIAGVEIPFNVELDHVVSFVKDDN